MSKINTIIREFEFIVGLSVNKDKSALLLKGNWLEIQKAAVSSAGYQIQTKDKYLGVLLSTADIPATEAYAPAIARAMGRASSMLHWSLDLDLRQKLLELCIMPVLIAPARVIYPTIEGIASVRTI